MGKGNHDWCCSASHGAGRLRSLFDLSRKSNQQSEDELGLTGIDCITLTEERRIEESPAAYRQITPVIDAQVVARMNSILTFKAKVTFYMIKTIALMI